MDATSQTLKPWVTFAGCVLVVVVLYWAQAVFIPVALAILLTFVLTPPVTWLERWIGRVPAVLTAVSLVFLIGGLAGWGLVRQMNHLADDLPRYRANVLEKIADVRGAGKGARSRNCRRPSTTSRRTSRRPRAREARCPARS
ncbi:MAG: AI-2E family transporter [Nitriliruptoraceae bacterium]